MTEVETSILRRIEIGQGDVLAELRSFRRELDEEKTIRKDHSQHNREDFQRILDLFEAERANNDKRFTDQTEDRQRHLNEQDLKIDKITKSVSALEKDNTRAKDVGWAVVAILGGGFTLVIGTIWANLQGLIHFKIG